MDNFYDRTKTGLFALGRLENELTYLQKLQPLTSQRIDKRTLDAFVQQEIENQNLVFFSYKNGNPVSSKEFEKSIIVKAVFTGYVDNNNNNILAWYRKNRFGQWNGVYFSNQKALYNKLNAYKMGFISFRSYEDANNFISNLFAALLPGEKWQFMNGEEDDVGYRSKTQYQILESYIQQVFSKLMLEHKKENSKNKGKIIFSSDNKYCIFNTGLLSKYAKDICLLGEVYPQQNSNTFTFSNPQIVNSKSELVSNYAFEKAAIAEWPDVVEFFNTISDIIYDTSIEIDMTEDKLNHIIEDGITRGRFPDEYKRRLERGELPYIASVLETSINNAQKIAKRNYKYVVPQYRPQIGQEEGKIQFLMPIYLDGDYNKLPDFALVLNEEKGYYVPETVLKLAWAYNNARVICKPDDSWLNPDEIKNELDYDDENVSLR